MYQPLWSVVVISCWLSISWLSVVIFGIWLIIDDNWLIIYKITEKTQSSLVTGMNRLSSLRFDVSSNCIFRCVSNCTYEISVRPQCILLPVEFSKIFVKQSPHFNGTFLFKHSAYLVWWQSWIGFNQKMNVVFVDFLLNYFEITPFLRWSSCNQVTVPVLVLECFFCTWLQKSCDIAKEICNDYDFLGDSFINILQKFKKFINFHKQKL